MTLTIHKEEDEQRQLTLKVEVAESRVQQAMKEKARELAREIHVPGFRKGRAPYHVILRRFGADAVRAETVEGLVPAIFEEALADADIEDDLYGQPSLEKMEVEPLSLEFILPLSPKVTLGDYRAIRKELETIEISDEAVDEAVERIQNQHQKLETADRPAAAGDVVNLSGIGTAPVIPEEEEEAEAATETEEMAAAETAVAETEATDHEEPEADTTDAAEENDGDDGIETVFSERSRDFLLDDSKVFPGTSFVENLIGLSAGEETEFSVVFPEDYEDDYLAGREVTFNITINEVKDREVPAIDDELAKLNGRFDTLAELREGLREDLHQQAEEQAKSERFEAMVDDLLVEAQMVYPPAAVELEIDDMIAGFRQQVVQSGWQFEDFLRLQNETELSLRDNFRENGEERLKRRLAIRQFILDEKITVEQADVDAALDERVSRFGDNEELQKGMRDYFGQGQGLEMISSEILNDKVNERITAILTGNAPDLAELENQAETTEEE